MALSDFRQFIFYFKYLWSPSDFTNMQTWLQAQIRGTAEGAFGGAVLSGLKASVNSGMTANIEAGIAVAPDGRLIVASSGTATFATPVGNPAKSLVVLRPKSTDSTFIPEPVNPSNSVPLHQKLEYDLLVLNGTPAASPVYPATLANDVVVMGVSLTSGQVTLLSSNFERSPISLPRKRTHAVRVVSGVTSYSVLNTDHHLDVDASAAGVTCVLPPASGVPGQDYTFVKSDSVTNDVAVSGTDLISGETAQYISDQWGSMTVRSVGTAWRVI